MADIPIQRLEIEHEVTCPICGALSERSTFDARLEMAEQPPARRWWRARPDGRGNLNTVTFDVTWTAVQAWLDCGHQVIRDGTLVKDWRALDEDVSMHPKIGFTAHPDGRSCSYHSRLGAWTFEGVKECLRTHRPLGRRPAGGAL
ncbi:MAG TPA: hypothetical protein VIP77_04785 [Jiangellaceae bacterium]